MNLLITGAWESAAEYIEEIKEMGHAVTFLQQEKDDLPCEYEWIEGVICNALFLYHPMEKFPNLRYIQLTSAGMDRVDMEEIHRRGITIHNARGVYSAPMAEYAVAQVLAIYKGLYTFYDQQKRSEWRKNRELRELAGSRILIIGCGSVGTECAKRFNALGCTVVGVDIVIRKDESYDSMAPIERLDEELPGADVVILTLPLTERTRGLINRSRLHSFKGILVNISRGAIIEKDALMSWNGCTVLDVYEEEPLKENSPLWNRRKTILTPHNSFVGEGNARRLGNLVIHRMRHIT